MMSPELRLRSISELLNERFFIPRYQRGYRWTPRQVEALLDDLATFQRGESKRDAYYCLQPIVVRRRSESEWELVDGQQRLTTIFLILGALKDVASILRLGRYRIDYETRHSSAAFLANPTAESAGQNIDYHHMFEAYQAVERWFDKQEGELRLDLLRCLTGRDGSGPNVRVIWYELEAEQDPEQAFVRLNVGRIPLSSAELIRALLLRSDRETPDSRDALQIAQDWDAIERRLHDDGYWYFLQSDRSSPPARIEYLFDIFVRTQPRDAAEKLVDDPLATFLDFQKLLEKAGSGVWTTWQAFKKMTQTLEDWYDDRTLYHLVGFLVATAAADRGPAGGSRRAEAKVLVSLLEARQTSTSTDFDRQLRRLAWRRFAGLYAVDPSPESFTEKKLAEQVDERIEDLNYGKGPVATALLLFNIAGLLEQAASAQRFQFDGYKSNYWDIEHVRSVAEYIPQAAADRKRWLEHAHRFVVSPFAVAKDSAEAQQINDAIDAIVASPSPEEDAFTDVFSRVRALSGELEARADDDALSNLVLLDMGTNRSYRNAIFPVKRARIIELDKKGRFVPPATRNVFLKYYSPEASQLMLWDDADQAAYQEALNRTLVRFFAPLVAPGGVE
jgi:hypothetical protein